MSGGDTKTTSKLEGWLQGAGESLPGPGLPWLASRRAGALERLRANGIPDSKMEGWRYTPVKSLLEQAFSRYAEPVTGVEPADLEDVLIPGLEAHRVVLVNGRFVHGLSDLEGLAAGVRAGSLREILERDPDAVEGRLTNIAGLGVHVFAAVNTAGMDDGFVLLVPPGTVIEQPIEVIHLSVGMDEPRVAQPRHLIALEEGAQVALIERYVSLGESVYCTNSILEISLGSGSTLKHDRLQQESLNAFHLTGLYLSQGPASRYEGVNVALGAAWARTDLVVRFTGRAAECNLKGLYLAGDKQVTDFHLDVEHGVPGCASRESFKGILYGKGRAVFDGRVFVAPDAQKTDAHLSNKNLVLSRSAEVDAKPQLEIHADDVKCSHGTTVGQIDADALFYLRTRGIRAPLARRMLCMGFAEEIIQAIGTDALQGYVSGLVGERLEKTPLQ
jgi:Fe-S cluster assembly protein SufD